MDLNKQSKQLYNEFILYMKNSHSKNLAVTKQIHYKHLHSQLSKQNNFKRNNIIECMKNRQFKIRNQGLLCYQDDQCKQNYQTFMSRRNKSACNYQKTNKKLLNSESTIFKGSGKFKKIQTVRNYEQLKTIIVKSQTNSLLKTELCKDQGQKFVIDKILLEQHQQKQLDMQISNYKQSLDRIRKSLQQLKTEIKKIQIKQNKFQQAYHLAQNINQNTQQVTNTNNKNYQKMLKDQTDTLNSLKKIKSKVKKDLQETQKQYHSHKKQHNLKLGKYMNTFQPLIWDNISTISYVNYKKTTKHDKFLTNNTLQYQQHHKFLISIQELLKLLQNRQSQYEELKQLYCTKIPSRKVCTTAFSEERAQWIHEIQNFQQKYQIRVQSSFQIIKRLYNKIEQANQKLEKVIYEKQMIRNDLINQYQECCRKKQANFDQIRSDTLVRIRQVQNTTSKQIKTIRANSKSCILTIELIGSLFLKFQHIFKLFFMMNVDKKKFNQHLHSLQTIIRTRNYTMTPITSYSTINPQILSDDHSTISSIQSAHQSINLNQVKQMIINALSKSDLTSFKDNQQQNEHFLQQLLIILFNDIRIPINCKKNLVSEQINFTEFNTNWADDIVRILNNIREECEYTFVEKFKNNSESLMECIRCIKRLKNTFSHDQNLYASNKLSSSSPVLPVNTKIRPNLNQIVDEEQQSCDVDLLGQAVLSYLSSRSQRNQQKIILFNEQSKKNPNQMVRYLHGLRNQRNKKFTLLDLNVNKNEYIAQELMQQKTQGRMDKKQESKIKKKIQFNNKLQNNYLNLANGSK